MLTYYILPLHRAQRAKTNGRKIEIISFIKVFYFIDRLILHFKQSTGLFCRSYDINIMNYKTRDYVACSYLESMMHSVFDSATGLNAIRQCTTCIALLPYASGFNTWFKILTLLKLYVHYTVILKMYYESNDSVKTI